MHTNTHSLYTFKAGCKQTYISAGEIDGEGFTCAEGEVMKAAVDFQKDLIKHLKDPEAAAGYLNAALAGGDPRVLYIALRNVAAAQGNMTKLAKKCNISRTNLYHMTSKKGNPNLENVLKIVQCLNLDLCFKVDKKHHSRLVPA
jgi:probable addiction module antidote protein